jgi:polysaccharide pyruvyl transferase WcaK-like protein
MASPTPSNRGDEAMGIACARELTSRQKDDVDVVLTSSEAPGFWKQVEGVRVVDDLYMPFTAGQAGSETRDLICRMAKYRNAAVLGADVLDESYSVTRSRQTIAMAGWAARAGLGSRILGFSMSAVPSAELTKAFLALPRSVRLMVRDPISLARMQQALGGRELELVADVAFLMSPASESDIPESIKAHLQHQEATIGLAVSHHLMQGEPEALRTVGRAISRLMGTTGNRMVMIPHHPADCNVLKAVLGGMEEPQRRGTVISPLVSSPVVKRILGSCNHVFSGRMHTAIAALGMGVPVSCFPYRGKFEGLLKHFGLCDSIIEVEHMRGDAEVMSHRFAERVSKSSAESEKIAEKLPEVLALARKNFEGIGAEPQ